MKVFCCGDIHGRFEALKQVLKKSKFNYTKDKLIVLGDIVDGGYNTYEVVEELLKIKNLIYIIGNHCEWFIKHINNGFSENIWLNQGGCNTLNSYGGECIDADFIVDAPKKFDITNVKIPVTHQDFFNRGIYYYVLNNMLFVHGGINPKIPFLKSQSKHDLLWDRSLINYCKRGKYVPRYEKVFVGHTTTQIIERNCTKPLNYSNLWMLDTGAGWNGKLTIMDVNTEEFWQSDIQKPAIIPRIKNYNEKSQYKKEINKNGGK